MDIFINSLFYKYYQKYPIKLIDVGASGGMQYNWKRAERFLQLIGFEPDVRSFHDLKEDTSSKKVYIDKALYKDNKTEDLYLTKRKEASSLFTPNYRFIKQFPNPERYELTDVSKIEVDKLDDQLEKHKIDDIDFMKLDTNGSELFVLEGATKALNSAFGLEIEVEFSQIYEGQPLFSDVDKFIRNYGFQLFDLKPYYWKREAGKKYGGLKGQLVFADALYLLDLDHLGERLNSIHDDIFRKSKILRSISIALLYGYIDYAVSIFEQEKEFFIEAEIVSFYKEVEKNLHLATRIPHFRGKGRIAGLFKALYNIFRHHDNGWSITQESLGNLE